MFAFVWSKSQNHEMNVFHEVISLVMWRKGIGGEHGANTVYTCM
jgi:hypothetical protein